MYQDKRTVLLQIDKKKIDNFVKVGNNLNIISKKECWNNQQACKKYSSLIIYMQIKPPWGTSTPHKNGYSEEDWQSCYKDVEQLKPSEHSQWEYKFATLM